jgi:circadian clock protein KaiC
MNIKIGPIDKFLEGGFPSNTNILVSGGYGTGKTLFGLRFIMEGLGLNERCCYVSLGENREDLIRASKSIKSLEKLESYLGRSLAIEAINIGETMTMRKFNKMIESYPKLDRLVIDGLDNLFALTESKKAYRIYLAELLRNLKTVSSCTLLLCHTNGGEIDTGNGEASECDGVIHLSVLGVKRKLDIIKLRYTNIKPMSLDLDINKKDIEVNRD